MDTSELYPELIDYLFDYECRFMTQDEVTAALQMQVPKDISFELLKLRGTPNNLVLNDNVKQMIFSWVCNVQKPSGDTHLHGAKG